MSEGQKNDQGKPRMSLLSSSALEELAKVMSFGAVKYQDHNWRRGFKWSRLMDATLRHINAFNGGNRKDPETNLTHLAHAMANLMMLIEFEKMGIGEDDLFKGHQQEEIDLKSHIFIPAGVDIKEIYSGVNNESKSKKVKS